MGEEAEKKHELGVQFGLEVEGAVAKAVGAVSGDMVHHPGDADGIGTLFGDEAFHA